MASMSAYEIYLSYRWAGCQWRTWAHRCLQPTECTRRRSSGGAAESVFGPGPGSSPSLRVVSFLLHTRRRRHDSLRPAARGHGRSGGRRCRKLNCLVCLNSLSVGGSAAAASELLAWRSQGQQAAMAKGCSGTSPWN
eukprot:3214607-Rhodomonas_salina.1